MNAEQKAIIAAAEKEGLSPCEKDARLVVHDMVNATRAAMRKFEVGFNKMTEKQQDAVLGELEETYKKLSLTIARTIASGNTPAVPATLKDLKISNGTLTAIVSGDEQYFNELISKVQDKSEVIIVLYERQYADAMDAIQADKDQRPLDLEEGASSKPAKAAKASSSAKKAGDMAKDVALPPKLVEDARRFITEQQNCKASALQNILKIGALKAEALQKLFVEEGLIEFVGTDASGDYQLVRRELATTTEAGEFVGDGGESGDFVPVGEITVISDELYDRMAAKVREKGTAVASALSIGFDASIEVAQQAIDRMELEGIIDADGKLTPEETGPDLNMD